MNSPSPDYLVPNFLSNGQGPYNPLLTVSLALLPGFHWRCKLWYPRSTHYGPRSLVAASSLHGVAPVVVMLPSSISLC
jgi:hypothetical protein